ncbi:MAG: DUF1667 domain-containing protein [Clostridiales bacterium]|nr:DUF1667 domain-containing protein [Clostridiales bacterium]
MNIGEKRELVCINCPMGCMLTATMTENGLSVTGNTCPRGEKYANEELTHPTRTLTTTLRVENREGKYVPVKTNGPISKEKLFEAMKVLSDVKVTAPVKTGDVVFPSLLGEADVIATGTVD